MPNESLTEMPAGTDRLTFRYRSWWLRAIMFCAMFAPGMALLVATPWIAADAQKPGAGIALALLGGLMILFGGAFAFGRMEKIVDRRRRRVVDRLGIFWLNRGRTYSFAELEAVTLRHDVVRTRNGRYDRYKVLLSTPGKEIYLEEYGSYEHARAKGEEVAEFVNLPLVDRCEGEPVVREPGALNLPVAEQIRRSGSDLEWPEPPTGSRMTTTFGGESVTIEIPPSGFGWGNLGLMAVSAAFLFPAGRLLLGVFADQATALWIRILFGGLTVSLLGGIGIMLLAVAVLSPFTRERITASARGITIERIGPTGTSTSHVNADRIEELTVRQSEGDLRVRGDDFSHTLGSAASSDELRWLYAVLRYTLVHGPRG